jgi:hypothetical protein
MFALLNRPQRRRESVRKLGGGEVVEGANSSCSALVALRTQTVLPISVTVADTWLAAAFNKIPKLVACVLEAVTYE